MPVTRPSFHLPKLPSNLFGRAPSPVVGISMSDSAVTAALMDIHTGQYHLLDTAIVPCYDAFLHGKFNLEVQRTQSYILPQVVF